VTGPASEKFSLLRTVKSLAAARERGGNHKKKPQESPGKNFAVISKKRKGVLVTQREGQAREPAELHLSGRNEPPLFQEKEDWGRGEGRKHNLTGGKSFIQEKRLTDNGVKRGSMNRFADKSGTSPLVAMVKSWRIREKIAT